MAQIGREVGGRYRLIELLGEGGMATIYRAHDAQLDRDVAVKILRPEYGGDPDFGARFRQEAQSAASLSHPNIVSVFDYGQDDNGPFIVMEYVDGEDLASLLRRNGAMPPRRAARLAAEIARALSVAHAHGIVHRDVKPGNVLLARDGRVKVADFGIARAFAEAQLTLPGTTLGSVHYFSPEQAKGEPTTTASDIYALGIVLYELLAGRRPWEGDTAASIALARLSGPPPMVSSVRSGVPPILEAIDRKALALDPAERFSSATAMATALDDFLADRGVALGVSSAASGADAAPGMVAGAARGAGLAGAELAGTVAAIGSRGPQAVPSPLPSAGPGPIAAAVARPNPNARSPVPDDFYARAPGSAGAAPSTAVPGAAARRRPLDEVPKPADERGGFGPWAWIAGLLGLVVLALAGFLLLQYVSHAGGAAVAQVPVPNFVGQTWQQAQSAAQQARLHVSAVGGNVQADSKVVAQDTPAGTQVNPERTVGLILQGPQAQLVPDVTHESVDRALADLTKAGLTPGARTDATDPVVPAGEVISTNPKAGFSAALGASVDYVVSSGPATPSPSESPSPTPSPSPEPTPTPQVTPTPPPPATPSPTLPPVPTLPPNPSPSV